MSLRGIEPTPKPPSRLKCMISGEAGIGKTWFCLSAPAPYYIDSEGGAKLPDYQEILKASGGTYMGEEQGASDFPIVLDEIKNLISEKHTFKTLVIDSFSKIYNDYMSKVEETHGAGYGRPKKEANILSRQLLRYIQCLDMNIILICHSKDKWMKEVLIGTTFDGYEKFSHDLDLWLEAEFSGDPTKPTCLVKKSRFGANFPLNSRHPFKFSHFSSIFGDADKECIPQDVLSLVTTSQLEKFNELVPMLSISNLEIEEWCKRFNVSEMAHMKESDMQKILNALEKKIRATQQIVYTQSKGE